MALSAAPAPAQVTAPESVHAPRPMEHGVELWFARGTHSPMWGILGNTPGVNMAVVAARFTRMIASSPNMTLEYTADVVPAAVFSPPLPTAQGTQTASARCSEHKCELTPFQRTFPPGSAFGAGVSPLGLTWVFRRDGRIRPVLATTGGMLWTDREMPTTAASRFNFTVTAEAGLRAAISRSYELTTTYRFHHLSNAGFAENVALASQLLSVGVRWHAERQPPQDEMLARSRAGTVAAEH
ncbi:MAG: acyloxyacyl hydrolase [Gemmatimonadaceae bacterium]